MGKMLESESAWNLLANNSILHAHYRNLLLLHGEKEGNSF